MKRVTMLFAATVGVLVAVVGGVVLAANISCPNRPESGCVGTKNADRITGTPQTDQIRARGGDDSVNARGGPDDFAIGGTGEDRVRGDGGDDAVVGGSITGDFETGDLKFADSQDDVVKGGEGDEDPVAGGFGKGGHDRLYGGPGDDTMYAAQRGFPFRGEVRINRELVNCGPGEDVAYIDRGVDRVLANCERKINGFPDMDMQDSSSREGSAAGLFDASE